MHKALPYLLLAIGMPIVVALVHSARVRRGLYEFPGLFRRIGTSLICGVRMMALQRDAIVHPLYST
jgi:hypothetical protein